MTLKVLCDAVDALENARDTDELRVEMKKFARAMGFDTFTYVLNLSIPSLKAQRFVLNAFPDAWLNRYVSAEYFKIDPLFKHAQTTSLPAIWNDQMFHQGRSAEFWEEARAFGLGDGVSFSIHDQPGVKGLFSIARDQAMDLNDAGLAELIGRGQLFAGLVHHAVVRLELPNMLPEQQTTLTTREQECLMWAAEGKTAWEIGQILGITERTAVFHINNVVQKLGASNKTQAIVRAVALRLV